MNNTTGEVWSESQIHLSTESDRSIYRGSFDTSPHSSFVDASYTATDSTPSFVHSSDSFSHPNSTSGSYDSQQPSDISGHQIYDAIGNGNSGIASTILTDALASSSMNSSLTGNGQDSLIDVHSRKTSLSSMADAQFPSNLVQSPEYEDSGAVNVPSVWHSASSSIAQTNPTDYEFRYPGGSVTGPTADAAGSTVFYTSDHISAGPSQPGTSYVYPTADSIQLMAPGTVSTMPMAGINTLDQFQRHAPAPIVGLSSAAPNGFSSHSLITLSDSNVQAMAGQQQQQQSTKRGGSGHTRGNSNGSTRRAKFRRSRTGCMVCRKRKVKCDQDGQPCKQCRIGKRECHYEDNPPKRKRKSKSESETGKKRKSKSSDLESSVALGGSRPPSIKQEEDELEEGEEGKDVGSSSNTTSSILEQKFLEGDTKAMQQQEIGRNEESLAADQLQQAREAAEELKRTTDALFAQHTNIDQVGLETEEELKASQEGEGNGLPDQVDAFSLQYTNDDVSIDSIEPCSTRSNHAQGSMTEDWTASTPSTGPSSNKTVEGDSTGHSFQHTTNEGTPNSFTIKEEEGRIDSPFEEYLGEQGTDGIVTIQTETDELPWFQNQGNVPESAISMGLGLGGGELMEGGEVCIVGQRKA